MELVCDKCGCIGIWFPQRMVTEEIKRHVEGVPAKRPGASGRAAAAPPHPGHVVKAIPDSTRAVI